MNSLDLFDVIYGLFLTGSYKGERIIKIIYDSDPIRFKTYLDTVQDIEFRNDVYKMLKLDIPHTNLQQKDINELTNEFNNFFHQNISKEGIGFLENRGIDKEDIKRLKIGDLSKFYSDEFIDYVKIIKDNYNKETLQLVFDSLDKICKMNQQMYGNFNYVIIPSFDKNMNNVGTCFRSISFLKNGNWKNLYKFHFFNAPRFLYGEDKLDEYKSFFVFEGVFDVIHCKKNGIDNCLGLGNNTLSKYQYQKIKDKKLHFIFDNDMGGNNGLQIIEKMNLQGSLLPGYKDIDEMDKEETMKFIASLNIDING